MHESRKFCRRVSNFECVFFLLFLRVFMSLFLLLLFFHFFFWGGGAVVLVVVVVVVQLITVERIQCHFKRTFSCQRVQETLQFCEFSGV